MTSRSPLLIAAIIGGPQPTDYVEPEPYRCELCLGPPGDDSRRCELPILHDEPHDFDGVLYVLYSNKADR